MKLNKSILFFLLLGVSLSACQSVKETLSNKKKANTNEFLVKKKDPLIMPPDYEKLPVPQDQKDDPIDEKNEIDFSMILEKTNKSKNNNKNNSLEKSISKILKNN